ncbi:MAG: chemotaxis protein CheX [Gammaproteobacteria bacterium]|jgi:CheY-specific phosphatase CheX
MDLYNVHTKILMPFVNETIKALADMADLTATAGRGVQEDVANYDFKGYAVCVVARTYGSIEGKVVMNHQVKSALTIGNRFLAKLLGEPCNFREINGEIGEALTEFSNTIIGLATRSLSDSGSQLQFSAPLFINGPADIDFIKEGVQEILSIPIDVEGVGAFSFSYLLHQKTG